MKTLSSRNKTMILEESSSDSKRTLLMYDECKDNSKKTMLMNEDVDSITGKNKTMVLEENILNENIIFENTSELLNGKYKIQELLTDDSGEADIYIATFNNKKYIVKLYRSRYQYNEEKNKRIKAIKSSYVIKILDEGKYRNRFFEVMPYYKNGDLTKYKFNEDFIKNVILMNLIDALKDIHDNRLIHRDIKPSNIFLSDDKSHVILGDFGISSVLGEKVTSKQTSKAKTLEYSAGETFSNIVTSASDYYSLGITIMEILTGKTSYEGLNDMEITKRKALNQFNIPLEKINEFYTLIKGLTRFSPHNRWKYDEVVKWINGENIEVIDEEIIGDHFNRAYKFNGKSITTREELAKELAINWNEGKKNFIRGYLSEYFKSIDQELASSIEDSRELVDNNSSRFDLEFFKVIHNIYPNSPMIWKGEDLKDIDNLINIMKRNPIHENKDYIEFIFNGALEFYLEINNVSQNSIDIIRNLRTMSTAFFNKAYYGFLLLNNNDFYYRGNVFNNIEQIIDFISENINESEEIALELKRSDYFNMWIKKLGFSDFYDEYMN